jgi:hypothetical protein
LLAAAGVTPASGAAAQPTTNQTTTAPATTGAVATGTAGAAQAQQGASQAQAQKAEPFQAPVLVLPDEPSTNDVLTGLTAAMADPNANKTTVDALNELHSRVFQAEQAMNQAILDLMAAT